MPWGPCQSECPMLPPGVTVWAATEDEVRFMALPKSGSVLISMAHGTKGHMYT